ncbi:MAG TPA: hypothetical protein VFI06_16010 [Chitinophagaceae bacterium]|nr:hypothetical protein [Chitinophagaceae bacterium]
MNKPGSSLSHFIEEYPLYSRFGTDQPIEAADLDNLAFNFFCQKEKEVQPFRLIIPSSNGNGIHPPQQHHSAEGFTVIFHGVCQSCEEYKITVVINGASREESPRYFIRKIGQYPVPESPAAKLPDDVVLFLDDEGRECYRRALINLEFDYGAGTLAYFKKMLAKGIDRIVETLSNPYSNEGSRFAEVFHFYKQDGQRTKFIEEATPHLPESLKEHGASILLVLYDALSLSIQELTEKECMKKSKDIDTLFRYLTRKINAEIQETSQKKVNGKYFLRYS